MCRHSSLSVATRIVLQTKMLSRLWQSLDEETHNAYILKAREETRQKKLNNIEAALARKNAKREYEEQNDGSMAGAPAFSFSMDSVEPLCPPGRIRRIMKLDSEVVNVTREAVALVDKAMQIFLEDLALKGWNACCNENRRALKLQDLTFCMHTMDEYKFCRLDFDKPPGL